MGGAGHIPKNATRKEDRVGELNFFRGSTKPQPCGNFSRRSGRVGWVEIPLALATCSVSGLLGGDQMPPKRSGGLSCSQQSLSASGRSSLL